MSTKFTLSFVQGLTTREKAELVTGKNFWFTAENKKHNIPKIMVTDGPSGLRKQASSADALGLNQSVEAISFPSSALMASSFNVDMLYDLGKSLGVAAKSENVSVLLGPGINIKRSPLAGRNFEYFSEDPYLTGELGSSYVKGVQDQGIGVSLKHFAANNRENQRFTSSSNVDERTLREIYLFAFEKIVKEAHPATIMCSYNAINGVLNSQNYRLLTEILRNEWGYTGLVMSDWGAVADNIASLKAGLDLEMPGNEEYSISKIMAAVKSGQLEESKLDTAVLRVLALVEKFQINEDNHIDYDKEAQHNFAKKAAEDSIVLLKNESSVLPIHQTEKIAVIGELAKKPRYQGGGSSHVNAYKIITPLEAAENSNYDIMYADGYQLSDEESNIELENQALSVAEVSDKVIIFAGVPEKNESEGFDKGTIDLPKNQLELIQKLAAHNSNVIIVLQNGSAISMPWRNSVQAVVETYLAGEAVGEATWSILTGETNPSGKLAETFPERIEDTPTYGTFNASTEEENYHEGIFVGYRYYDLKHQQVAYPFGHGLSYTSFKYENLEIDNTEEHVSIKVNITNVGQVPGKEVVQFYVQNLVSSVELPSKELKSFKKIELNPGESKLVEVVLDRRSFSWYDVQNNIWRVDKGEYIIKVGSSSQDIRLEKSIFLEMGIDNIKPVSGETYISEIINRKDLQKPLIDSGLKSSIDSITAMDSNRELMENMPLRAIIMIGANVNQVNHFINLANGSND
ncbi:MAG: beta-glucosidase family protein [Leuconostoc suionicum]|uniref:beta-glucosidase n=1 Tax=Leuconostoc suionicum TaxID=1511761 RepID=UPI003F2B7044